MLHALMLAVLLPVHMAGEDRTMPLFEVRIGDRADAYWFLIDTGSSYNFIDARLAERHGFNVREGTPVRGAGGVEVKTRAVDGVTFTMGGMAATFDDVRLTDLSGLEPMFGHRIDGFFGYPLLARYVVTIGQGQILLTDPARFRPHRSDISLPLRFAGKTNRWIYVRATIKYPGNGPEPSEFLVDSGSQDDANHPSVRKSTGKLREIRTGTGLGSVGAGTGVIGRAEWIRLGPFKVADVESNCCPPLEGTERMIGQGVLSKFIVTYDYSRARMLIRRR